MKSSSKKARISNDFEDMSASEGCTFGDGTVAGLTGNAAFPHPLIVLATVSGQIQDVRDVLTTIAAGNTSKANTTLLATKLNTLMLSLTANGHYVEDTANISAAGNVTLAEELILTSGYKLRKKNTPKSRDFEIIASEPGWIHVRAKKSRKGTEGHLWRFGIVPQKGATPVTMIIVFTLEADVVITDLTSGTLLAIQHASITPVSKRKNTTTSVIKTGRFATPVPTTKAKHPVYSITVSDPYVWTAFIYFGVQ